jgi:hypothetical protein
VAKVMVLLSPKCLQFFIHRVFRKALTVVAETIFMDSFAIIILIYLLLHSHIKVKVKQSRYRPGVARRVPGT